MKSKNELKKILWFLIAPWSHNRKQLSRMQAEGLTRYYKRRMKRMSK